MARAVKSFCSHKYRRLYSLYMLTDTSYIPGKPLSPSVRTRPDSAISDFSVQAGVPPPDSRLLFLPWMLLLFIIGALVIFFIVSKQLRSYTQVIGERFGETGPSITPRKGDCLS